MIQQYENLVMSSFILWLDHEILSHGQAFTNCSSKLYRMPQTVNGYSTYTTPFAQLVSDLSISNANIPTGLYLNGSFIGIGVSGLAGINYDKGQAYFSTPLSNTDLLSGSYAVKDVNITMPNLPDINILFETKIGLRNKISVDYNNYTGISNADLTYPAIFVRNVGGQNTPFAFGGTDETETDVELYIFADSQYLLDATKSIIKDRRYDYIPLLSENRMPFNNMGSIKGGTGYNYINITSGLIAQGSGVFIKELVITDFNKRGLFQEAQSLTKDCYFAVADIKLVKARST